MCLLKTAISLAACAALAACGSSSLTTGSLIGQQKPQTAQSIDGAIAVSPDDPLARPIQVAWTSARAVRCGFYFDPKKLKGAVVAAEAAKGATSDQINKVERSYDYTFERVSAQITGESDYCAEKIVAEVRGDLNRHLAGDYTVNARKVAQNNTILDSLSGQTSTIKPMDPKRIFDNSRNSQSN